MNKFYISIFFILLLNSSFGSRGKNSIFENTSILSGEKETLLKKINTQIALEEKYINSQVNWIGWDCENLLRLVLINKKFKGNLVLNKEEFKLKSISEFGYYLKMYGEEIHTIDPKVFEEAKQKVVSHPNKADIVLTMPNYKELIVNPFIANVLSAYADKIPLNDTAIDILKKEFSKNNDAKVGGLIYFYQLGQKQKDENVKKAFDSMKNEVLAILDSKNNLIDDELKIKAIAAALYSGIIINTYQPYIEFLSEYQSARNGSFSNSQKNGNNGSFIYDESINVYGYWALLQLRELVK